MNFALNEEQKMVVALLRRFIADELKPLQAGLEAQGRLDYPAHIRFLTNPNSWVCSCSIGLPPRCSALTRR